MTTKQLASAARALRLVAYNGLYDDQGNRYSDAQLDEARAGHGIKLRLAGLSAFEPLTAEMALRDHNNRPVTNPLAPAAPVSRQVWATFKDGTRNQITVPHNVCSTDGVAVEYARDYFTDRERTNTRALSVVIVRADGSESAPLPVVVPSGWAPQTVRLSPYDQSPVLSRPILTMTPEQSERLALWCVREGVRFSFEKDTTTHGAFLFTGDDYSRVCAFVYSPAFSK